jgi:hypothetical protein
MKEISVRKKRGNRIFIAFIIFLIVLVLAVQLFLNRYLVSVVHKRLESLIIKGSDSLYRFKEGKLSVNFLAGKVEVENLQIRVDSTHYKLLEKAKTLPALTFELDIPRVVVEGIDILPLLVSRRFKINNIITSDANVHLSRHFRNTDEETAQGEPLWKAIRNDIKQILIKKLLLDSVKISYTNADSARAFRWQFDNCSASLENIRVDSIGQTDSNRIMFTKNVAIIFNDVRLRTVDSLYRITAGKVFYSSEKRQLNVQQFSIEPSLNREGFYTKIGKQKDMLTLRIAKLDFKNFKLQRFISNNELVADSANIQHPEVSDYFDRTMPEVPENKLGRYPPQLLLNAAISIRIKKINVEEGQLTYTELDNKNLGEGKIVMSNINGTINNVTNNPSDIKINSECIADLTARVQTSTIHAKFDFHLNGNDGGFSISGNIKNVDGSQLNSVTIPLAKTRIESFRMHEMEFTIEGNEQMATGNMRMRYNDLRVQLNKEDAVSGKLKTSKFLTKLLARLTIRSDNPLGKEPEKIAKDVKYVRDPHKAFFAIVWRTMFACMQVIAMNIKGLTS